MKVVILLSLCFLFSCAQTVSDKELLDESKTDLSLNKEEIEARLTRFTFARGGDYEFSATPISNRLIEAEVNELSLINGLTAAEQKSYISYRNQELTDNKSCLKIKVSSIGQKRSLDIRQWNLKVVDHIGREYPVEIDPSSIRNYSQIFSGLYGLSQKRKSNAFVCTRVNINWDLGFKFIFQQQKDRVSAELAWGKDS